MGGRVNASNLRKLHRWPVQSSNKTDHGNLTQVAMDGSVCQSVPTELTMLFSPTLNLAAYSPPVVGSPSRGW